VKGNSTLQVTKWFFDKEAVVNAVDKATRGVLSRFGAYVRRTAKSSIRQSKNVSKEGSPPRSHTGLLKQFIFFAYDPDTQGVVIGPEKLNAKIGSAPETLEYGGQNTVATYRRRKIVGKKVIRIAARPYMHPALAKELPGLPEMWANSAKP
jgi:hypothetical protein